MIEAIREAIGRGSWEEALHRALEAWRELRAPELADLIDEIALRCDAAERAPRRVPHRRVHAWWIRHAANYDPAMIATLAEGAWRGGQVRRGELCAKYDDPVLDSIRKAGCGPRSLDVLERALLMLRWPDDPRTAQILTDWFVEGAIELLWTSQNWPAYTAIASRLIKLRDARVLPRIVDCLARGNGLVRRDLRVVQRDLAKFIAQRLFATITPPVLAAQIAACARLLPASGLSRSEVTEQALWRRIAEAPADLEPRAILADYLIERGDPRGQVIAWQLHGTARAMLRAHRLIRLHRRRWLGPLDRVLTRRRTKFRNGMLEEVGIGMHSTPESLYEHVTGHRELATVHTVHAQYVNAALFARFVDQLPSPLRVLGIDTPLILVEMLKRRAHWPVMTLAYTGQPLYDAYDQLGEPPSFATMIDLIASSMPKLELLCLSTRAERYDEATLSGAVAKLQHKLPQFRRIIIECMPFDYEATRDRLMSMPAVSVVPYRTSYI